MEEGEWSRRQLDGDVLWRHFKAIAFLSSTLKRRERICEKLASMWLFGYACLGADIPREALIIRMKGREGMRKIWGGKHQTCGMTEAVSEAMINSQLKMDEFRLSPSCSELAYQHTVYLTLWKSFLTIHFS